jgi:putative oxidoreductase
MPTEIGRWSHAVLRIGAGLLFLEHGLQKLFGFFGGIPGGPVPLISQLGVASVLEIGGGTLLMLGLMTRPVAAILVIEMLVAFFTVHAPQGGWPIQNQGELALLYAAIFCFLAGSGAGALSLDAWRSKPMRRDRRHIVERRHPVAA